MLLSLPSRLPTVSIWHATSRCFASRKRKKNVYSKEKPKVSHAKPKAQKRSIVESALLAGHVMSLKHHNAEILLIPSNHKLSSDPHYRKLLVELLDSFSPTHICAEIGDEGFSKMRMEATKYYEGINKDQSLEVGNLPTSHGPLSDMTDMRLMFNYACRMQCFYYPVDIPHVLTTEYLMDAFSNNADLSRMKKQVKEQKRQEEEHMNDIPEEEYEIYAQFLVLEELMMREVLSFQVEGNRRNNNFIQATDSNLRAGIIHATGSSHIVVKRDITRMPIERLRANAEHAESLKSVDNARNYLLPHNEFAFEVAKVFTFKRNDYMTQKVWELAESCKPNSRFMFVVGAAHAPGIEHAWSQLRTGDAMTMERLAKIKQEVDLWRWKSSRWRRWRFFRFFLPWHQWRCRKITAVALEQRSVNNQYKWRWEAFRSLTPSQRQSIIGKGLFESIGPIMSRRRRN